jgi:hypothetical protein
VALLLASRAIIDFFAISVLVLSSNRKTERTQQRSTFLFVSCCRRNRNIQPANRVYLIKVDLWKNNLLFDANTVVALIVE